MPETCLPIRTTGLRSLPALIVLLVGATLAGCSGGDFGRTRADMRNDDMHRWLGAEATASVGLKPSQFQLTENERQLRDLAYPLIEPPRSRPAWKSVFGDYQPLPSPWRQKVVFDRTTYGRALIDEPHRSHTSRYQQLIEDVRNDITRFEPFFASAARVVELDRKRNASLEDGVGAVAARAGRRDRAHGREHADRAMGPAMPGAAHFLVSLGAGAAGDPGAGQHRRRRRPADRRTCRANRQSAASPRSP